ncbi:MAG: extracellular solute-binding protein [Bacillota bacterium]
MSKKSLSIVSLLTCFVLLAGSCMALAADYDFGGRTVVFAGMNMTPPPEGSPYYDAWKAAEEEFNAKIEFRKIDSGQIVDTIMAAVLAGDPTIDIVQTDSGSYAPLVTRGALRPIGHLLPDEYWESIPEPLQGRAGFKESRTILGQCYGLPMSFGDYIVVQVIGWNKDMFEREGLPSLYDLVESGEWTWEKMREIAAALTADTDGDGQIDRYGVGGMFPNHSPQNTLLPVLATNGVEMTRVVDGKVVFDLDAGGKASAVLEYVRQMIVFDKSVDPAGWNFAQFHNEKVGMYVAPFWATDSLASESFTFGVVLMPKGPDADDYTMNVTTLNQVCIPVSSDEDTEALIALWNAYNQADLVWEDVNSRLSFAQDAESYELMMRCMTDWELFSPYVGALNNQNFWYPMTEFTSGRRTAAEIIAEITPSVQAVLDDMLGQ